MKPGVQRLRPGQPFPARVGTVVVIDVLRMTTTAAVLMRDPSRMGVAVAATLDDLAGLGLPQAGCVVVSELLSAAWPGSWVDNSPVRAAAFPFGERTPVLVTTNGTRALLAAAACADRVLLASFVDLSAVARHLLAGGHVDVGILPAGHFATGEPRTEDDLCADALAGLLAGEDPAWATIAAQVRSDDRVQRRAEQDAGYAADVDVALSSDRDAEVLCFDVLGAGIGRISRV